MTTLENHHRVKITHPGNHIRELRKRIHPIVHVRADNLTSAPRLKVFKWVVIQKKTPDWLQSVPEKGNTIIRTIGQKFNANHETDIFPGERE
jgi:predicted DNA-binding ribbon-helix-helix protein